MVTFDAVVQDFHVCLTEHLVVEFLGDDVWEHLLAIPMDTSSLTTREFSQSGFSGCIPVSCPPSLIETRCLTCLLLLSSDTFFFLLLPTNKLNFYFNTLIFFYYFNVLRGSNLSV